MKKKILPLLLLIASGPSMALTLTPNVMAVAALSDSSTVEQYAGMGVFTTVEAATTATSSSSPILGVIIFADGQAPSIDLENEDALDEVESIQITLEEGGELTEFQETILEVGINNGQLDESGNILE